MPRRFFAIFLPRNAALTLAAAVPATPSLRPVPAGRLHLTLRWLGELVFDVAGTLVALRAALRGVPPLELSSDRLEAFPACQPRVFAATLVPSAALSRLVSRFDAALDRCGLPRRLEPFRPHVTVARFRDAQDVPPPVAHRQDFVLRELALVSSSRARSVPLQYEVLERIPFV